MIWACIRDLGTYYLSYHNALNPLMNALADISSGAKVKVFINIHTLSMQAVKALVKLRGCVSLSKPSMIAYVISTKI